MLSILVLIKDEENSVPAWLGTVWWSDNVHLLDSYSTDQTVEIAIAAGAHVCQMLFDSCAGQHNWALRSIPFKYPWVFYFDAHERVTTGLRDSIYWQQYEIRQLRRMPHSTTRFLPRHLAQTRAIVAVLQAALRPEKMRYERIVHPVSIPRRPVGGYLDNCLAAKGLPIGLPGTTPTARWSRNNSSPIAGSSLLQPAQSS
jgi:hypothetical protein